ncbi:MAG: transposase [Caldisphaeraceae archaeon]|nr:transposase [Caldisphaeraceae archaeon]MEB3797618.1 transposase [Caldisphaeraceae archaeon]
MYINPKNTSKLCPIHSAAITYSNGSRIGRCSKGKEMWHGDTVVTWNPYLRVLKDDESDATSPLKFRFASCRWGLNTNPIIGINKSPLDGAEVSRGNHKLT